MSSFDRNFVWRHRLSSSLLISITLLFPLKLLGADQAVPLEPQPALQTEQPAPQAEQPAPQTPQPVTPTPQPVPLTPTTDRFDSMEVKRNYLSGKITSYASYIDRFFGGDRHYQESNESVFQLDLTRTAGFGGERKFDLAARLNLRLPITEGRLHLLLETDPEKNIKVDPTPGSTVIKDKVVVPRSVAVAARYATAAENVWHFSTDAGLKFPLPVIPFVRARGSYSIPFGNEWRLKAAESVYWFNTMGAGATTQLDLEQVLSSLFLFRSSSTATWLNDKQNFDLRQDLSVYHTLNDRTALLYQTSAIWVSSPAFAATDYVALMLYRYRLHREWLFFEISPQLHFPLVKQYHLSPALSLRLEVLFDDSR
ncbi:MAG: hypothetical protein ABI479_02940 [Gallionella sp.]